MAGLLCVWKVLQLWLTLNLVLEEDVDGGGGAAVHVRVPAPGHVFHEADVTGAKHVPGPITGANLDVAGQMNDQPAFGFCQLVEVETLIERTGSLSCPFLSLKQPTPCP